MEKVPESHEEMIKTIMYTAYMGTENSSEETKVRARIIAEEIGAYHLENKIDDLFKTVASTFATIAGAD